MMVNKLVLFAAAVTLLSSTYGIAADTSTVGSKNVKHVLLLSIDGMHAVDFYNCAHGIAGANSGEPYCPNLAALGETGESRRHAGAARGLVATHKVVARGTSGAAARMHGNRRSTRPRILTG
jgi:hypothetical protein